MQTPSLNHNPLDSGLPIVRLLSLVLGLSLPMSGFAADAVTVNGERNFNLGPQTTFTLDGETISAAQAAQMGAGYSVQVAIDNANATATSGDAVNVDLRNLVRGPVTATDPLSVLNQALTVTAETVLVGIPGNDLANVAVDDLLEVSGYLDVNGAMAATRIELRSDPTSDWKLFGQVAGLAGSLFAIGAQHIDFSGASPVGCVPALADGQFVELETLPNAGYTATSVLAQVTQIECEDPNFDDPPAGTGVASLEGIISAIPDPMPVPASFSMLGVEVLTTEQTQYRAGAVEDLDEGVRVEVEGAFDEAAQRISATEIRFVQGQVRFEAPVDPADVVAGETITIMGNTVQFTPQTRDEDGIVAGLAAPTQVEVRGLIDRDGQMFSTRVRERGQPDLSDTEIRGPAADIAAPNLSILGINVDTGAAIFRDHEQNVISADEFFARLFPGTLVSAEDAIYDPVSGSLIAGEMELEEDTQAAAPRSAERGNSRGVSRGTLTWLGRDSIFAAGFD